MWLGDRLASYQGLGKGPVSIVCAYACTEDFTAVNTVNSVHDVEGGWRLLHGHRNSVGHRAMAPPLAS